MVAVLYLSFWPYVAFDFGFHNDFEIWAYNNTVCCSGFPETAHLIRIGRFLQAFLQNVYLSFFSDLHSLAYGRALGIGIAALAALMLARAARRAGMEGTTANAFGLSAFLLPPAQVNLGWVANFVPGVLNPVLVLFASLIFPDWQAVISRHPSAVFRVTAAGLVLLAALFIYPPTVGLFLIPVMVRLMYRDSRDARANALYAAAFFGCVCLAYFGIHRTYMTLAQITFPAGSLYEFSLSRHVWANLLRFACEVLPTMLNLWNPAPLQPISVLMLGVIVAGVAAGLLRTDRAAAGAGSALTARWLFPALLLGLFLAVNAPSLVGAGRPPLFYRAWHPGAVATLLFVFYAVAALAPPRWATGICGLFVITGSVFAFDSSRHVAQTLANQFDYAVAQIHAQFSPHREFYVLVEQRPESRLFGRGRWGELGFIHILSAGHVVYILRRDFNVSSHPRVEQVVVNGTTRALLLEPQLLGPPPLRASVAGTATASGVSDPAFRLQRALDNIYYTFWETAAVFPVDVDFRFFQGTRVACYALSAGDDMAHERMPRSWTLFGSPDGDAWAVLDRREGESGWTDNGRRTYRVSSPGSYPYYRLGFDSLNGDRYLRIYGMALSPDADCRATFP